MKRTSVALALVLVLSGSVTGCMGTSGLSGDLKEFNLEVTENRYGREAIFFVLNVVWVYRICTILDLFIFNSVEFWSGTNPFNGKSPLVDVPMSEVQKIGFRDLERAQVELVAENTAKLTLDFQNGDHMTFDVVRDEGDYRVSYLGRALFEGKVLSAATPVALETTR